MPALNFQSQFAEAVKSGKKWQTIRKVREYPIKVGDTLYLYTGMRTKKCRKLRVTICTAVIPISIDTTEHTVSVYGDRLTHGQALSMALADGFESLTDFCEWFAKQYKQRNFEGVIIRW